MKFAHVFVAVFVCIGAIWLHDHWRISTDVLKQPRLAEWAEAGQYFNYRGMPIFYRDSAPNSTKPLILLLHGYPSSSFDWHKLWPMFEHGQYRVVAPDFLGFGFSAKPQYIKYSLVRQANVVEALMKSLGVAAAAEVHVIAHDYAVSVVQELLARDKEFKDRPFRLLSVVFLNGGLFPEAHRPLLVQKLAASPYTGWLIKRFSQFLVYCSVKFDK
jgi:pimeloyl-ACP methyl ester carboxylesterase